MNKDNDYGVFLAIITIWIIIGFILLLCFTYYGYYKFGLKEYEKTINRRKSQTL